MQPPSSWSRGRISTRPRIARTCRLRTNLCPLQTARRNRTSVSSEYFSNTASSVVGLSIIVRRKSKSPPRPRQNLEWNRGRKNGSSRRSGSSVTDTTGLDKPTPRNFEYPVNRSEEHTSELQSLRHLVCRLL